MAKSPLTKLRIWQSPFAMTGFLKHRTVFGWMTVRVTPKIRKARNPRNVASHGRTLCALFPTDFFVCPLLAAIGDSRHCGRHTASCCRVLRVPRLRGSWGGHDDRVAQGRNSHRCSRHCWQAGRSVRDTVLLAAGADPSIKNKQGKRPADYATDEVIMGLLQSEHEEGARFRIERDTRTPP